MSQSDLRASFGLGTARSADKVDVIWPTGEHQVFQNVAADKFYRIEEGKNELEMQNIAGRTHPGKQRPRKTNP